MQALGTNPAHDTNVTTRICKNTSKAADPTSGDVQPHHPTQSTSQTGDPDAEALPQPPGAKRRKQDTSVKQNRTSTPNLHKMATASITPGKRAYDFGQNPNGIFANRIAAQERNSKTAGSTGTTKGSRHDGVKRLTVRNLQPPKTNPQQYFDKIWAQLDVSSSSIFRNEDPPYSLEELYKGAENLCRQGNAEALYNKLRQKCREHAMGIKEDLVIRGQLVQDVDLVQAFVESWAAWDKHMVDLAPCVRCASS